jgi:hypothetical protein
VIRNISASLKPGGRLVLDYLNVNHAERGLRPEQITEIDGTIYRVTRWMDAWHFFKRIEIADPREERLLEYVERVAKFRLPDFERLFASAGLWIEEVFGNYRLDAYDVVESPRVILVARKIASADAARPVFATGPCEYGSTSRATRRDTTPASTVERVTQSMRTF